MANIKSQIKRIKTNEKRNLLNKSYKSKVRNMLKKTEKAINEGTKNTKELLTNCYSLLDKAVVKGVFHKNKTARKKAKITNLYNKSNQQ